MAIAVVLVAFIVGVGVVLALASFAARIPGCCCSGSSRAGCRKISMVDGRDDVDHDAIVKAGKGGMMPALDRAIQQERSAATCSAPGSTSPAPRRA